MRFFAYQFLTSIGSTSFVSIIVIGIRRCVLLLGFFKRGLSAGDWES